MIKSIFSFLIILSASSAHADITSNLVNHWKFDELAASTSAFDSGSQLSTGSLSNNATWYSPIVGKASVYFNGSQWVDLLGAVATQFNGASTITVAGWFRGPVFQSMVRLQMGTNNYFIVGFSSSSPQAVSSTDGGVGSGVNISTQVRDNRWHHIAIVWQANTVNGFKSYFDGQLYAQRTSIATTLPSQESSFNPCIGRYGGNDEYMVGSVDDIRLYARALSAADILELYNLNNWKKSKIID